jgi:hypothetical protein
MQYFFPDIKKSKILVNPKNILGLLGSHGGPADAHASDRIDYYIHVCMEIMSPSAGYVLVTAEHPESAEEIAIDGVHFQSGKIVSSMLKHSEIYAFFLVTAGPGPEKLARDLLEKGEYLDGYITDLVASALADAVADCVHEEIRKEADSLGMKMTNRYSPGYCSWDVAEQQKLFSLFPENSCGISLSESSLMSPVKSISGIVGMGPRVKFNAYTCKICPMKDCLFSKERNQ